MTQVLSDIWPYLLTALLGAIGWQFRESYLLKTKVAVMEKSIASMQTRLDSHSKKQDDILNRINSMEKEVLKETGSVRADISSLASDVKGLSNLILASDNGIRINRQ
jgi:outer membrane lipopolysaccharide assembly protein LptE/RlpB